MQPETKVWCGVVGGVAVLSLLSLWTGPTSSIHAIDLAAESRNALAKSDQDKNVLVALMDASESLAYANLAVRKGQSTPRLVEDAQLRQRRALKFIHDRFPKLKARGWS